MDTSAPTDGTEVGPPPEPDAGFATRVVYTVPRAEVDGFLSGGVTATDVDGDDRVDVLAANGSEVLLFRGRGDVGLEPPEVIHAGAADDHSLGVWTYDFDRDGDPDVLYGGWNGLEILLNDGTGSFAVSPDRFGIEPRRDLLTSIGLQHLDQDAKVDLFLGYVPRSFGDDLFAQDHVYSPSMEAEIYLRDGDGRFVKQVLPVRDAPGGPVGYGWYTLHVIPFKAGVLALADLSRRGGGQSAYYWKERGTWRAKRMEDVVGFVNAPMGGFCDYVLGSERSCWMSDSARPPVFVRSGDRWFESGARLGLDEAYFGWSVIPEDFDLDGRSDVFYTLGFPFLNVPPLGGLDRTDRDGLVLYHHVGARFRRQLLSERSFIGTTLADLDGDGLNEIVAREVNGWAFQPGPPPDGAIHVLSQRRTAPTLVVVLDESCLGASVEHGGLQRVFAPYASAGSFGNGPYTLVFPRREGATLRVLPTRGRFQEIEPVSGGNTVVTCHG